MKLSISNIAWDNTQDERMYEYLYQQKISGIEIAPTRLFPDKPYEHLAEAEQLKIRLAGSYHLEIASMQSIWFGREEKLFHSKLERNILLDYTKQAIRFAAALGCGNLVFGCPKNRVTFGRDVFDKSAQFFYTLGEFAVKNNTVLAVEPNPVIYHTDFLTTTEETIQMVRKVSSAGCKVNLDLGTMLYNQESVDLLSGNLAWINHIHISEPHLALIEKRTLHRELSELLQGSYAKYVSIEMGKRDDIREIDNAVLYLKEVFS